ncbi:MAG TPA: PfkB family carbohydrate kinase [bacterium]|nr:PfkB family carbohydrate kinase [bacterium]
MGVGLCVADYQCLVPRYPARDEKTEAVEAVHQGGAPVPTALVALATWKRKVALIGAAGDDDEGCFIKRELSSFGVNTERLSLARGKSTPRAFVWIDRETGGRTVVLARDNAAEMKRSAVGASNFPQCRVMHTDGRQTDVVLAAMRLARKRGVVTVIDAGSPRERMLDLFAGSDHFVASHTFVRTWFGARMKPVAALGEILKLGPSAALVTLGENGCVGATKNGVFKIEGRRKPGFIVDTTGAGDVFHGGYIHGLLAGWQPDECARFANAAAFLSCGSLGARKGIPRLTEINKLLQK